MRDACDIFAAVYERPNGGDGYVSIEVSPGAANDADGNRRRSAATLGDGRSAERDDQGARHGGGRAAPSAAHRRRASTSTSRCSSPSTRIAASSTRTWPASRIACAAGKPIDRIASVASFFVSRVDTEVDKRLDALAAKAAGADATRSLALKGKAAIANAQLAYQLFREEFSAPRWAPLEAAGARLQRPLWASTSTKNPAYRDVMYVEELIGPDTVNTMPPATIEAFRDHGEVAAHGRRGRSPPPSGRIARARRSRHRSCSDVTDKLLVEGLASFQKTFDSLIAGLEKKSAALGREMASSR